MNRKEKFIEKSIKVHNGKYDYSKVDYIDSLTKVCIICPEHGEFWQTPQAHARGNGCPICANKKRGDTFRSDGKTFEKRASEIHNGKYIYDEDKYVNSMTKVPIICPQHGEFLMTPMAHLNGQGCPKCSGRGLSTEEVVDKFKKVHGNKYDYSKVIFDKMHKKVCIICLEHGEFYQTPTKHLLGQGCPKCAIENRLKVNNISTEHHNCAKMEDEICSYLEKIGVEYERNNRTILDGSEIDILIPSKSFGIECDGLKWHSEEFKPNNYHLTKTNECAKKGIRLFHIYEDEWLNKKDIIKDKISSVLGKTSNKVYARNCTIKIPSEEEKRKFINETHIQGDIPSSVKLGLYYQNELVAIMTFGKLRLPLGHRNVSENQYELLRYSTKLDTSVIGGASKLFKYFVDNYSPKEIISYCDLRFSVGNLYEKLGFTVDHISQPNYYYIIGNNRKNRFRFRKSKLVKNGYDSEKSEHEIMLERKIYRIYDCGNLVFKWIKNGNKNISINDSFACN